MRCVIITARKRSLRRLCFYRCLSVHTGGGHAWFYLGGMHGFIWGVWVVLFGGMGGFIWGCVWFYLGGHAWFYSGGHAWFFWGRCVVFSVFSDTMRFGQWAGGTHPTGMHSCDMRDLRETWYWFPAADTRDWRSDTWCTTWHTYTPGCRVFTDGLSCSMSVFNHPQSSGKPCNNIWKPLAHLGCARFPEFFLQNFSERQLLWSLCSVVFHALTLRLPIQTSLSVSPKLQVCVRSGEKCQNFSKTSTPHSWWAVCRLCFSPWYSFPDVCLFINITNNVSVMCKRIRFERDSYLNIKTSSSA